MPSNDGIFKPLRDSRRLVTAIFIIIALVGVRLVGTGREIRQRLFDDRPREAGFVNHLKLWSLGADERRQRVLGKSFAAYTAVLNAAPEQAEIVLAIAPARIQEIRALTALLYPRPVRFMDERSRYYARHPEQLTTNTWILNLEADYQVPFVEHFDSVATSRRGQPFFTLLRYRGVPK